MILPFGDLLLAAGRIFIERNAVALDQVLAPVLDEPGAIFCEMLGTLGQEIAELVHHLVTHKVRAAWPHGVFLGDQPLGVLAAQFGIEVAPATINTLFEIQEEGDMVDPRHAVADIRHRNVEVMRQLEQCVRHRMAQTDSPDIRKPFPDGPAIDRHRVHILQHHRVRAELFHVGTEVPQEGHGAKPAHDPADAERVGDGLAKSVFLRDLEIGDCAGLVAADLH